MADVFISYAREDKARAQQVAQALAQAGVQAFWDSEIPPGQTWADYIEGKLTQCKALIVLWSSHSTVSQWVREEARIARDKGKLIPAMLDASTPPFGFGEVQTANLSTWNGDLTHVDWLRVKGAVLAAVGAPAQATGGAPQASAAPQFTSSQPSFTPHPASQPRQQFGNQQFAQQTSFTPQGGAGAAMSPIDYIKKCLTLFANGQGRARRAEFWWWFLFAFVLAIIAYLIDMALFGTSYAGGPNAQWVSNILSLALLAPNVSLAARRLHDVGMNGWLAAPAYVGGAIAGFGTGLGQMMIAGVGGLLLIAGGLFLLVVAFLPGQPRANQYGPDPKNPTDQAAVFS